MPTDQPDASDLRERVADLEATVSDQQETIQQLMPSRRQALAGAGLLGGGLLGGRLSTGTARAQAAGAQGTEDSPNDMFAWDLDVQNGVTSDLPMGGNDVTDVGALDVGKVNTGFIYAAAFDGADADARLNNAISKAAAGQRIYLESDTYTSDRTIGDNYTLIGTQPGGSSNGTTVNAIWTFNSAVTIKSVQFFNSGGTDGSLTIDETDVFVLHCGLGDIQINDNRALIQGGRALTITFASGTSNGIADSLVNSSVTDNGSNTVGDIS